MWELLNRRHPIAKIVGEAPFDCERGEGEDRRPREPTAVRGQAQPGRGERVRLYPAGSNRNGGVGERRGDVRSGTLTPLSIPLGEKLIIGEQHGISGYAELAGEVFESMADGTRPERVRRGLFA